MFSRVLSNLHGTYRRNHSLLTKVLPQPSVTRDPFTIQYIPYRLQVVIQTTKNDMPSPEKGEVLTRILVDAGLQKRTLAFEQDGDSLTIYNYWTLADANTLLDVELRLPDEPDFAQFDELLKREVKNLVLQVNPQSVLSKSPEYAYIRSQAIVPKSALAEFAARIDGHLVPFARASGWALGDTYLSLTGRAGTIVQMWRIPPTVGAAEARVALQGAPWAKLYDLEEGGHYKWSNGVDIKRLLPIQGDPLNPDEHQEPSVIGATQQYVTKEGVRR